MAPSPPTREIALAAGAGGLAALVPALLLHGFTVDDALIPARYATHLARGLGYRFNAGGPVTDGVTPLGFPYLLAPFAGAGPLAALAAAKVMGIAAWTLAAAVLGVAIARLGTRRARFGALAMLAASTPLAAWSGAGLETGLAAALGALAVALPELGLGRAGAVAAGLTAALRPDALPWALVASAASGPHEDGGLRRRAERIALGGAPFVAVAALRAAIFGRVVPLSVLAKPSDLDHGAPYALACFLLTGPIALLAPWSWIRLGARGRWLLAAVATHFLAVAAAGGDWMPVSRLVVPVLPTVILAVARLAEVAAPWSSAARLALALLGEGWQLHAVGPDALAGVDAARRALVEEMRPALEGARVVAALDVGWVGAATDATIVDLAGLTDPAIAVLPGGHTSKAVPAALLRDRDVDAVVLLLPDREPLAESWTESAFSRRVEQRVARFGGIGEAFAVTAESRAPHLHYVVVRRVTGAR